MRRTWQAKRHRRAVHDHAAQHDQPGYEQGVITSLLGPHEAGQPDRACGASDVLHRGAPNEPRSLKHLLHDTRGLIPAPARRGRRDQTKLIK